MVYKLRREVRDGKLVALSLGIPEVDSYLDFLKHRCRPNTWLSYAYDLQVFLNAVKKPLASVTTADIFGFIRHQRELPARRRARDGLVPWGPGLSPRTIHRRLAAVSGLYAYLLVRGDTPVKVNPVPRGLPLRGQFGYGRPGDGNGNGARGAPLFRARRTLPRLLEKEEVERFLDSLRTRRDRAMVLLMLLVGLRKSEVLGLTLEDMDLARGTAFVREGKGGHQRVVPVSPTAMQSVLEYLERERPASPSDRVFLVLKGSRRGQPLSGAGLDTIMDYHRRRAGTPRVQSHRLRHTCLTRLRQAGMSLEALQAQAGHRSILSTRVYLHLCPKELQEEYLRLSDILFNSNEEGRVGGDR